MIASESSLYGRGVFTTISICDRAPFLWEKHCQRLWLAADRLGIDLSMFDRESLRTNLDRSIAGKGIVDGKARITFSDQRSSPQWRNTRDIVEPTTLGILVGQRTPSPEQIRLSVSPYPIDSRSPLAGVKSCNYLEQILSVEEARNLGFDEAIRVNENGFVTSACMANVFWLRGGELFTPSLSTGCLTGTTRAFILENLECNEVEVGIEELHRADAIFLTSAGLGAVEIAQFENRKRLPSPHKILRVLPF